MLTVVLIVPARRRAELFAFRSKALVYLTGCLAAIPFLTQFAISAATCEQNPSWKFSISSALAITLIILARALTEEILYRWILWSALSRIGFRIPALIVLTAIIFAAFHAWKLSSWVSWVYVFSAGLLLGLVRFATDSVLLATLVHTCWNLASGLLYGMTHVAGIPETTPAVLCKTTGTIHPLDLLGITVSVAAIAIFLRRRRT
ncbi:MAG: CPBP family intramembrane metalloprotease [Betaproteobacteria bacterium]|nr:MAG: CPBP family intramembrane metalloprotease [Betaproteobacteria bacterium]